MYILFILYILECKVVHELVSKRRTESSVGSTKRCMSST
jgi:hypothetical protein